MRDPSRFEIWYGRDEPPAVIAEHLADHYAFYGEAAGVRIARKHLGWYTRNLAGGEQFRQEINAVEDTGTQLAAVRRFFDRLADAGERLDYRAETAKLVNACTVFGQTRQEPLWGEEALARTEAAPARK